MDELEDTDLAEARRTLSSLMKEYGLGSCDSEWRFHPARKESGIPCRDEDRGCCCHAVQNDARALDDQFAMAVLDGAHHTLHLPVAQHGDGL